VKPVVLVVDVGGSKVKALASTEREVRRFRSGPSLTAQQMVDETLAAVDGWTWDVVSIGVPGLIHGGTVVAAPRNLGDGWVGFDFEAAFGKPTKVVNDAVMQAVGSYRGGRMLFLGLGTGLGSALIYDGVIAPLELGRLRFRKKTYEDYVSTRALERRGEKKWKKSVFAMVELFTVVFQPDEIVLGGGDVDDLDELPPGCRRGANANAFVGGFRLWDPEWPAQLGG
jgi:polyphosphate glucokinase